MSERLKDRRDGQKSRRVRWHVLVQQLSQFNIGLAASAAHLEGLVVEVFCWHHLAGHTRALPGQHTHEVCWPIPKVDPAVQGKAHTDQGGQPGARTGSHAATAYSRRAAPAAYEPPC